jgi:Rrf2 family iron-sulfur cluster assembly transcriptional regulator
LKILRKLVHSGIIRSFKGVNGGYTLNHQPEHITLLSIIELIDGPICINRCFIEGEVCSRVSDKRECCIHKVLFSVNQLICEELKNKTLRSVMEND